MFEEREMLPEERCKEEGLFYGRSIFSTASGYRAYH
jgi:hypothetical protein